MISLELQKTNAVLAEELDASTACRGIFVQAGEAICTVYMEGETVYGRAVKTLEASCPFQSSADVEKRLLPECVEFVASKDGYVVTDADCRLFIFEPVQVNSQQTKMLLYKIPVTYGIEALVDHVFQLVARVDEATIKNPEERICRDEVVSMMRQGGFEKKLIRKGVEPRPGKSGEVVLLVSKTIDKIDPSEASIDFKEISPYQEIQKGTEIARKIMAVEGVGGKDIFGRILPVERVMEAAFRTGDHIVERSDDGAVVYVADIDGILTLRDDYANIDDVFKIAGDVSIETGNVRYSKDIVVYGNVCAGFTVECGGNLLVRGGLEDGATVICGRNLVVAKGVFGQRTTVSVGGSARIGFIQNSRLRVEGDLDIRDYVYQSDVFCRGVLQVQGKEVLDKSRGCVIGGKVNSMRAMVLHSAGSELAKTELVCGVDLKVYEKLRQLKNVLPVLNQKISRLRNQVDFDITDRNIVELLKKLPEARREHIKKILAELKETLALSAEAHKKIQTMNEKVFVKDDKEAVIEIKKGVVPPVFVRMKNQRFQIAKPSRYAKVFLKDAEVICEAR
jgi:uncharacterized protein (DUF342 family)